VAACFAEEAVDVHYLWILHSCYSATYAFHTTYWSAIRWYFSAIFYATSYVFQH